MTTEEKLQVIRQHFKDKGMKQADVAKALGVSRATVCNLMNGAPFGRRTAYEWSKTFGFSKDFLINGTEPMFDTDCDCAKGSQVTQNITGNSGIAVQQAGVQGCTRVQAQAPAQTKAGANDSYFARLCSELLQRVIDKDNEIQALRNEISRMKNEEPGHANQDSK